MTPQPQPLKTGASPPAVRSGLLQEVFNLDEGPVTLTVPATLSEESYADLADQLELFLRRAKRRATMLARYKDPEYLAAREDHIRKSASTKIDEDEE